MKHDLEEEPNIYNFTMTCRLDSDIPWTYAEITEVESGRVIAPALNVNWREPDNNFSGIMID